MTSTTALPAALPVDLAALEHVVARAAAEAIAARALAIASQDRRLAKLGGALS